MLKYKIFIEILPVEAEGMTDSNDYANSRVALRSFANSPKLVHISRVGILLLHVKVALHLFSVLETSNVMKYFR
jgi:hypothetical protein